MDKEQQVKYLKNLQKELETSEQKTFCENQAVNGLIQEYAARAEKAGISLHRPPGCICHIPIDDLTLCIVIGNLLENAMEASKKMTRDPFIRIQARMDGEHLLMLVENAYNGTIHEKNGKILSSKKDGGLGMLSIQRILNRPKDEFDIYFNDNTFTAMVRIGIDQSYPAVNSMFFRPPGMIVCIIKFIKAASMIIAVYFHGHPFYEREKPSWL